MNTSWYHTIFWCTAVGIVTFTIGIYAGNRHSQAVAREAGRAQAICSVLAVETQTALRMTNEVATAMAQWNARVDSLYTARRPRQRASSPAASQ